MRRKRRSLASVQEQLPLEDISGDVVRLRGGELRAVLQAGSVNFALKAELEQEAILAGYRRMLNGLSYPLQILVRVVPADVEAYLSQLDRSECAGHGDTLGRLALDHELFVRQIARERALLDRRFYVVIPAGTRDDSHRRGIRWPWRTDRARLQVDLLALRRRLALRSAEVTQGLMAFGVPVRRLDGDELVALWREVLTSDIGIASRRPASEIPVVTRAIASPRQASHA